VGFSSVKVYSNLFIIHHNRWYPLTMQVRNRGKWVIGVPKSVRNYVSNIISKLQVADRAQAILRAKEAGLGA